MAEQAARKVPQIRFKGFDGEWAEKELGDLIGLGSGRDYKHLSTGDIPVYGTGGYMLSVSEALSPNMDAVGIGRKGTIDKPYILRAPFWTVDTLFYAIPKLGHHLNFLYCIFQRIDWKQRDESTGVPSLSKVAINGVDVLSTNPSEQTQIGKYFRGLDSLIGLHQRKHDKLVTLKKAMLQKMFPQPGATTPEIRFKGFEGDWVEKPLGELIDLGSGRDYKHLSPGKIPVYGTGGYMLSVNDSLSNSVDAVGIGRKGTIDKPYVLKAPFWTVDTLFYAIPKTENYLDFIYCIFQQIDWKQKDESTGVPSLSKVAVNGVGVFSTSPQEQKKIGTYFRTLDALISQHTTQLQKLQQLKSACLEKMFV